jgi:hypothetical protein
MLIGVGDLVQCRTHGQKVGLVIDKRLCNEGLEKSMHVRHMIGIYPQVYYVFFSEEGKTGPYHVGDLTLQQSCQTTSDSIVL